jgi:hypothetical protein
LIYSDSINVVEDVTKSWQIQRDTTIDKGGQKIAHNTRLLKSNDTRSRSLLRSKIVDLKNPSSTHDINNEYAYK